MTTPTSVPLRAPLIDLQMDSDTAYYVGMLEGTIAALVVNEVKFRTLLELLTGDKWDSANMPQDPNALAALAVSMLIKQTGIDQSKAESLVAQRFGDMTSNPIPEATIITAAPTAPPMSERFKSWKAKQTNLATSGEENSA